MPVLGIRLIYPFITFFVRKDKCEGCVNALTGCFHPFFASALMVFEIFSKKTFPPLFCEIFLAFLLFPNFFKILKKTMNGNGDFLEKKPKTNEVKVRKFYEKDGL